MCIKLKLLHSYRLFVEVYWNLSLGHMLLIFVVAAETVYKNHMKVLCKEDTKIISLFVLFCAPDNSIANSYNLF